MISDYEGDVVTLCNFSHVNVGYKYLLLFIYDVDLSHAMDSFETHQLYSFLIIGKIL